MSKRLLPNLFVIHILTVILGQSIADRIVKYLHGKVGSDCDCDHWILQVVLMETMIMAFIIIIITSISSLSTLVTTAGLFSQVLTFMYMMIVAVPKEPTIHTSQIRRKMLVPLVKSNGWWILA